MVIKGQNFSVSLNGEKGDSGKLEFDGAMDPARFDQHITAGDDAGESHLGIVRFRDGQLEICQGEKGGPRPKDFAKRRKDDASLAMFKKVTMKKRPKE